MPSTAAVHDATGEQRTRLVPRVVRVRIRLVREPVTDARATRELAHLGAGAGAAREVSVPADALRVAATGQHLSIVRTSK